MKAAFLTNRQGIGHVAENHFFATDMNRAWGIWNIALHKFGKRSAEPYARETTGNEINEIRQPQNIWRRFIPGIEYILFTNLHP